MLLQLHGKTNTALVSTCNLTCGVLQYTVWSPEGQELECSLLEREHEPALWQKGAFSDRSGAKGREFMTRCAWYLTHWSHYGNQVHWWILANVLTATLKKNEWSVLYNFMEAFNDENNNIVKIANKRHS